MRNLLLLSSLFCLLISCSKQNNLKPLDLRSYGAEVTIMAPENSEVKKVEGFITDITVRKDSTYEIQIFLSEKTNDDIAAVTKGQLELVKENPFFSKILKEETDGFLYENQLDGASNFGFRRIVLSGNQEIIFQNALLGTYSKEQAESMYEAVKQKK